MFRSLLRLPVALIAVLGVLLVAACSAPTTDGTTVTDVATGPRTAVVDAEPEPITTDPAPALPATVRGVDGVETTITDISRIVVADRSGTLAQTVYALGLGDKLVGRSTASFPAIQDVPNVTPGGHGLNAEAILASNPTVVLTDTSIGPLAVQEQIRATGVPVVFVEVSEPHALSVSATSRGAMSESRFMVLLLDQPPNSWPTGSDAFDAGADETPACVAVTEVALTVPSSWVAPWTTTVSPGWIWLAPTSAVRVTVAPPILTFTVVPSAVVT